MRKPRTAAGIERREAAPAEGVVVIPVRVGSTPLVRVDEGSVLWTIDRDCDGAAVAEAREVYARAKGSFVRVRSPKGASDELVDAVVRSFREVALAVKVERPRRDAAVVEARAPRAHRSLREAVVATLAEAVSKDRAALETEVEAAMIEEGL